MELDVVSAKESPPCDGRETSQGVCGRPDPSPTPSWRRERNANGPAGQEPGAIRPWSISGSKRPEERSDKDLPCSRLGRCRSGRAGRRACRRTGAWRPGVRTSSGVAVRGRPAFAGVPAPVKPQTRLLAGLLRSSRRRPSGTHRPGLPIAALLFRADVEAARRHSRPPACGSRRGLPLRTPCRYADGVAGAAVLGMTGKRAGHAAGRGVLHLDHRCRSSRRLPTASASSRAAASVVSAGWFCQRSVQNP